MCNIKIISGRSNILLAEKISRYLKISLCNRIIKTFSNGELHVEIKENIRNQDIFIINTGSNDSENSVNDFLIETLLIIDTCKRSMASSINLIIPCYPYARQDRKEESRVPISAKLVADMFQIAGVNRIIMLDLHSPQIQGFFNISVDNMYSIKLVQKYINNNFFKGMNIEEIQSKYFLVSPDAGSAKRTLSFGNKLNLDTIIMHKQRNYDKMNTIDKMIIISDGIQIKNKTAIICDDMCDTGGTLLTAVNKLIENEVKNVIVVVTHGILSGNAIQKINNNPNIIKFITSDSLPQENNMKKCDKIDIFTVSELLGDVIKAIGSEKSISNLF